jgi:hypothetical protein
VRYAGNPAIRPPEPLGSIGFPAPRRRGGRGLGWAFYVGAAAYTTPPTNVT